MMIEKKLGDFYWAYADILRGIGINESMYDQRIMAFMALKLLADNEFVIFDFDYQNGFNLKDKFKHYQANTTKESFLNIIKDVKNLGSHKLQYFMQPKELNPNSEDENILYYLDHQRTFELSRYIEELPNNYLEMVLDIYTQKAHFVDYPKEQYKDLYETTISRMKKLSGDLTGQHFTQKSIIHLMCESVINDLKNASSDVLAIYDPTCGTGSMLMEATYYIDEKLNHTVKGNRKKTSKPIEVYGQEMHGQTWFLCKIFLEISKIPNKIAHGNTLVSPAFDKINGKNSFDFIIANPPFGVDWKHDYDLIVANMELEEKSNFLVVKDDKNKIITPKKSDGQFLFMLHILKLLEVSKQNGKNAKAAVISSSTLSSTGNATSSESHIRKALFATNTLTALVEQPNAMFTNTDISSHIWFFDTSRITPNAMIIKTSNDEQNLYSPHPRSKDKMKNAYSEEDIVHIMSHFAKEQPYISKKVDTSKLHEINIQNIIKKKVLQESTNLDEMFGKINHNLDNLCRMTRLFA